VRGSGHASESPGTKPSHLDHQIHVVGQTFGKRVAPVGVGPLFHDCDGARPRRGQVLLRFDSFANPGDVDEGNEFSKWAGGGLGGMS
jgi:hypothetical protein